MVRARLERQIWPNGLNLEFGFTDLELESMAEEKFAREERRASSSPFLFWTSEIYSHGKTLRALAGWPHWLPVPVSSDHGVHFDRGLSEFERKIGARTHLTWSAERAQSQTLDEVVVLPIVHPWVSYRKAHGLRPDDNRNGAIIFPRHSLPAEHFSPPRLGDLLKEISHLDVGPRRVLCLGMHDIHRGLHRHYRSLGLPIVTLGHSSAPNFVDRFYSLVSQFELSVSNDYGSYAFFAEEFGVPFFLAGPPTFQHNEYISRTFALANTSGAPDREQLVREKLMPPNPLTPEELRVVFRRDLFLILPYALKRLALKLFSLLGFRRSKREKTASQIY